MIKRCLLTLLLLSAHPVSGIEKFDDIIDKRHEHATINLVAAKRHLKGYIDRIAVIPDTYVNAFIVNNYGFISDHQRFKELVLQAQQSLLIDFVHHLDILCNAIDTTESIRRNGLEYLKVLSLDTNVQANFTIKSGEAIWDIELQNGEQKNLLRILSYMIFNPFKLHLSAHEHNAQIINKTLQDMGKLYGLMRL